MKYLFQWAAFGSALLTAAIFVILYLLSLPLLSQGTLWTVLWQPWDPQHGSFGIYPMVVTSLSSAFVAIAISTPLCFGCALFITQYGPRNIRRWMLNLVRLMGSIPTVVYGFTALFLLVPRMREALGGSGLNIATASLILALLIAPTLILFFVDSITQSSQRDCHTVTALGGTRAQVIRHAVLPQAWPGLVNGILLGLGRAMGDTLISLMLAGNSVQTPDALTDSARTLTAHIALVIAADVASLEFRSLFACAIVLYLFSALLVIGVRWINHSQPLSQRRML